MKDTKAKKENGVTLIALVVSIIVLVVLAGVSISLVIGDNGIITKAREAKENFQVAAEEEGTMLNALFDEMNQKISSSNSQSAETINFSIQYDEVDYNFVANKNETFGQWISRANNNGDLNELLNDLNGNIYTNLFPTNENARDSGEISVEDAGTYEKYGLVRYEYGYVDYSDEIDGSAIYYLGQCE